MRNSGKKNLIALVISIVIAIIFIAVMGVFLKGSGTGTLLLGEMDASYYPFTLQNIMHMFFFIGLGQLIVRWIHSYEEKVFMNKAGFLSTAKDIEYTTDKELEEIQIRVANTANSAFLPDLIDTSLNQYFKSKSISDTLSVMNSNLEMEMNRMDLRYSMIRYVVWAIPTFGFIGTVIGIAQGLGSLDINELTGPNKAAFFAELTSKLSMAFNTTIIALSLSAILVFLLHLIQKAEEEGINESGQHVLRHLINKIKPENQ